MYTHFQDTFQFKQHVKVNFASDDSFKPGGSLQVAVGLLLDFRPSATEGAACVCRLFKQVHACLRFILWAHLGEWPMRNNEHYVQSPALLAHRSRQQCSSCSILKSIRACCVWWRPGKLLTISARCENSIAMELSPMSQHRIKI